MIKNIAKDLINNAGFKIIRIRNKDDVQHYIQLYGKDSVKKKRFYNISAGGHFGFGGDFYHPCWTNIDFVKPDKEKEGLNPENEIGHDLLSLKPLPIEAGTAELIQSQYAIEHITDEAAEVFFKEAHRALKTRGVFRIVVPNNELDYMAYTNNDRHYFHWIDMQSKSGLYQHLRFKVPLNQASFEQVVLVHFAANASTIYNDGAPERITDEQFIDIYKNNSMEDFFNICSSKCSVEIQKKYRQSHINWWTNNKLKAMLQKAGFKHVYILSAHQSIAPVMRNKYYFDKYWTEVAIFIEAVK
jgi:predicted SAM-dependent methyltransferase